jgi:hypothetical protein
MSGRFPKGGDLLADIRRQGFRPALPVLIHLDADRPLPMLCSDLPTLVDIIVRPRDAIEHLDFWPVVDLDVHVHGGVTLNDRLRALLRALVKACPRFLMGAVPRAGLLFAWSPARGWEWEGIDRAQ